MSDGIPAIVLPVVRIGSAAVARETRLSGLVGIAIHQPAWKRTVALGIGGKHVWSGGQ